MNSIDVVRIYEGFCSNCDGATVVGDLGVKNFQFILPMCSQCLSKLSVSVEKKTVTGPVDTKLVPVERAGLSAGGLR